MSTCTDFCERLKVIDLRGDILPSHDELVAHLQLPGDNQEQQWLLGSWHELLQRTQCGLCQLVVAAISNDTDAAFSDIDAIRPNHPINIVIFPGEQSFRLSYPSCLGLRLAFVADDYRRVRGPDTARPIDNTRIEISQITSWLSICDEKHKACSLTTTHSEVQRSADFWESATSNFRLIDLEVGCVKPAALDTKYVTLSYVWGQLSMFRLQKDNLEKLSSAGSLENIRTELPQTVNDAIDFVIAIGERYLWIDGLCLVQDDEDDISLGIEMMNSIYSGSYLTIVAASGSDANAGLPGVGESTRVGYQEQAIKEVAPGIRMTVLYSIDWYLSRSAYNTRGWTLQELVLSRRTIIFINRQVYFRCQEANWSEESWADKWTCWLDADDSNISRIPDFDNGRVPSLWAYQKLCEDYSQRKLRNDGDALRALAGVSRLLAAAMGTVMVEGVPGYYLDHFLLFVSSNGHLRRRPEFASFSWAGWEGRIMWPRENFVWHNNSGRTWQTTNLLKYFEHNRIVNWKALDATANLNILTSQPRELPSPLLSLMRDHPDVFGDVEEDPERSGKWQWHGDLRDSSGVPQWKWVQELSDDDGEEDEECAKERRNHLQAQSRYFMERLDLVNGQVEFDQLRRLLLLEGGKLNNWMAQRYFQIRRARQDRSSDIGPRSIRSQEGKNDQYRFRPPYAPLYEQRPNSWRYQAEQAASEKAESLPNTFTIPTFPPYTILYFLAISLNLILGTGTERHHQGQSNFDRISGIPLLSGSGELVGSLHPDNLDLLESPGSVVECIIISHCNTPTVASALLGPDGSGTEQPWDLFWILHVAWENGVAERRGVGQIICSALEKSVEPKPEVKLVLLG